MVINIFSIILQSLILNYYCMSSIVELQNAGISIKISCALGGRIVFLSKDNSENILQSDPELWDDKNKPELSATSDFKAYNGHIVWLGPQCDWWKNQDLNVSRRNEASVWPPDPFIIYGEYTIVEKTDRSIILQSPESPIWGVQLRKEIVINDDGTVYQNVTVTNVSSKTQSWDIWYNTRMNGFCKAYVPITTNSDDVRVILNQLGASDDMPYTTDSGFFSFQPIDPDVNFHDRSSKAFVYPEQNYIVGFSNDKAIKIVFEQHKKEEIHPEQALVEIYNYTDCDEKNALLELEYHSPYKTLAPGDSMQAWEVWEILDYNGTENAEDQIAFIKDNM